MKIFISDLEISKPDKRLNNIWVIYWIRISMSMITTIILGKISI